MAIATFKCATFSNPTDLQKFVVTSVTTIYGIVFDVGSCQYVLFYTP